MRARERTKFVQRIREISPRRYVIYAPRAHAHTTRFFMPEEFPLRVYNKAFLSLQLRS